MEAIRRFSGGIPLPFIKDVTDTVRLAAMTSLVLLSPQQVTGKAEPGRLLAIFGPSGSGTFTQYRGCLYAHISSFI